jgi:hypothetical protein
LEGITTYILCNLVLTACRSELSAQIKTTLEQELKGSRLAVLAQKILMFLTSKVRKKNLIFNNRPFLGASPKLHGSRVVNKPEFSNQNWDIAGAGPRALHMPLNKPVNNLKTDDIKFSSP